VGQKQVLFHSAAREKILRGATQLADAVKVTLGPKSKSVLIERKWGTLGLPDRASCREVDEAAEYRALEETRFVATFSR
jgi:hypothetical protein